MVPDFLIIGFPKAGTQWLTAFFDAHPDISCVPSSPARLDGVGEPHFFCLLESLRQDGGERLRRELQKRYLGYFADLAALVGKIDEQKLVARCRERFEAFCNLQRMNSILGVKSPDDVWYLPWVDRLYPGIKKICILRDPKDELVSYFAHKVRQKVRKGKPAPILTDAFVHAETAKMKAGYENLLSYKGELYCLRYESLQSDQRETFKKLLSYVGARNDDALVRRLIAETDLLRLQRWEQWLRRSYLWQNERRLAKLLAFFVGRRAAAALSYRCGRFYYVLQRKLFNILYNHHVIKGSPISGKTHFRKGVSGDWRNHLSEEQAAFVDREIELVEKKVFQKYGIATNTRS